MSDSNWIILQNLPQTPYVAPASAMLICDYIQNYEFSHEQKQTKRLCLLLRIMLFYTRNSYILAEKDLTS